MGMAHATSPSIIDSYDHVSGWAAGHQRSIFYAEGLNWKFYANADAWDASPAYEWRTSADGVTWSAETVFRVPDSGAAWSCGFSIWYDGTHVHYAYAQQLNGSGIYYRMGTPCSNGAITWAAAEQVAQTGIASHAFNMPIITVDSDGNPWIGFYPHDDITHHNESWITKSSTGNGTWTTDTGLSFPEVFSTDIDYCSPTIAVPQTDGKMYAIHVAGSEAGAGAAFNLYGTPWNGATWGSTELIGEMCYTDNFSTVNNGDIIDIVYTRESADGTSGHPIAFRERSAIGVWGAEVLIQAGVGTGHTYHDIYPTITLWNASGDLRVVWSNPSPSTANQIYYVKRTGGAWGSAWHWIDASAEGLYYIGQGYGYVASAEGSYGGYMGVSYTTNTYLRFALLSFATVTIGNSTEITPSSMTLNGAVTNINDTTITEEGFEWGTATGIYTGNWTQTGTYGVGSFSHSISGLAPNKIYYFRAKACNTDGWAFSAEGNATTTSSGAPSGTTGSATSITTTTTTLQGTLDSLGGYTPVYVFFQYGLTTSYGTNTVEQTKITVGGINQGITGLTPSTIYHFRIAIKYGVSSYAYSSDGNFTTSAAGAPTVTTNAVVSKTSTGGWLQGTLTTLGDYSTVSVYFNYGLTGAYGNTTASQSKSVIGSYNQFITGLPSNTLIYYRAVVEYGSTPSYAYGSNMTFTTMVASPTLIDTGTAVSITNTSAILQGTLTSLGDYSPVYVYFHYGLTTSYGTSTVEQTRTSTGSYTQAIATLTPNTTYHFRAVVRYAASSYVYGADGNFTTLAADAPTVATGSATSITNTEATLQGTLTGLGSYTTVYTYFQWGLTDTYGTTTIEQTKTSITGYSQAISGLSPSITYHFRAVMRYSTASYVYGSDTTLTTTGTVTLGAPTGLTATRSTGQIAISWSKGSNAINTMVRRSTTTYPSTISDGVQVYFGTGASVNDTGLTDTQGYYYSAWSELSSLYSSSYATVYSAPTTGTGVLNTPDTFTIYNVMAFKKYQQNNDQIILIYYEASYNASTPTQDVRDFLAFELYSGSTLIAKVPVQMWGERPGSIYLASSNVLNWGQSFTVKIVGRVGQWGVIPSYSYSASSYNWDSTPNDLSDIDTWVWDTAVTIDPDWVVATSTGYALTDTACTIFNRGIAGLSNVRATVCYSTSIGLVDIPDEFDTDYQDELTAGHDTVLGSYLNGFVDGVSTITGTSNQVSGYIVTIIVCLIMFMAIGFRTGSVGYAIAAVIPVLIFHAYAALIGIVVITILLSILVLYAVKKLWA